MPIEVDSVCFEQHRVPAPDGRSIVVWVLSRGAIDERRPAIVIGSGMGRRMDHLSPLATYLAWAGFTVYRFDPLDHVGLSDGTMTDFTMSSVLTSLNAVADWMVEKRGVARFGLLAMSLMARVAVQLVAERRDVQYLITAVGVVNLRRTLEVVWGADLVATPRDRVPAYAEFERHYIRCQAFGADGDANDWWSLEGTVAALRRASCPIVCIASVDDRWVDIAELREAFRRGDGGPRQILEFEESTHDIGRNAAIARLFLQRTTANAMRLSGLDPSSPPGEPSFERLTEQALAERRIERAAIVEPPTLSPEDLEQAFKMVRDPVTPAKQPSAPAIAKEGHPRHANCRFSMPTPTFSSRPISGSGTSSRNTAMSLPTPTSTKKATICSGCATASTVKGRSTCSRRASATSGPSAPHGGTVP